MQLFAGMLQMVSEAVRQGRGLALFQREGRGGWGREWLYCDFVVYLTYLEDSVLVIFVFKKVRFFCSLIKNIRKCLDPFKSKFLEREKSNIPKRYKLVIFQLVVGLKGILNLGRGQRPNVWFKIHVGIYVVIQLLLLDIPPKQQN